jgi:hypothetical protein
MYISLFLTISQCALVDDVTIISAEATATSYGYAYWINHGNKHLCLIFGVVPSVCSKVMQLVVKKLKNHPLAKVRFLDADKMALFVQLIQACEP